MHKYFMQRVFFQKKNQLSSHVQLNKKFPQAQNKMKHLKNAKSNQISKNP